MTPAELLPLLVLLPLLASALAVLLPTRWAALLSIALLLVLVSSWPWLAVDFHRSGAIQHALAGHAAPLGIQLQLDGPGLLFLGLSLLVMSVASVHALAAPSRASHSAAFWPSWLLLLTGLNMLTLAQDLFNAYVGLELLTLASVALVASAGSTEALRAAMRYLLLAMLASLALLLGVALLYAASGTLDMVLLAARLQPGLPASLGVALILAGLLLKAAMFPLHGWLPLAHGSAPGPVSAVLSALVVKVSILLLWRVWRMADGVAPIPSLGLLLASLGCAAILWGALLAFRQQRLKRVIAYSTVAQLGYLMLVLAMPSLLAWQGALLHMLSHGLSKAAMFLAAANMMRCIGNDRLDGLPGIDSRLPVSVFAFALASVSLMGLPPSGGFLAKWLLLLSAWNEGLWPLAMVIVLGSLLAAAYLFRVLGIMMSKPAGSALPASAGSVSPLAEYAALLLAFSAIVLGFAAAPMLALSEGPMPAIAP